MHPHVIPELTQQIAYTIEAGDGDIRLPSDRMNGMSVRGGPTFHADYMEGWPPVTRNVWTGRRISKLPNCSDREHQRWHDAEERQPDL